MNTSENSTGSAILTAFSATLPVCSLPTILPDLPLGSISSHHLLLVQFFLSSNSCLPQLQISPHPINAASCSPMPAFLGNLAMDCVAFLQNFDVGFGFLFYRAVCLLLLFFLGLISWFCKGLNPSRCNFSAKSRGLKCGSCSECGFGVDCGSKTGSCGWFKSCGASPGIDFDLLEERSKGSDSCDSNDEEEDNADEVFDVLTLRKMVKIERRKARRAQLELEKERAAASGAAEEAMAMILRLQKEKSRVEMEAKQYKRMAQEKQHHDQEVIRSLQWLLLKQDCNILEEDELELGSKRLKHIIMRNKDDEEEDDESSSSSSSPPNPKIVEWVRHRLFSSLDLDLSLLEEDRN